MKRVRYCKLETKVTRYFKGKVTTLKICDALYKNLKKHNFDSDKMLAVEFDSCQAFMSTCPYCGNSLVHN